jgi:methylglutaconyl-CoA hydratase
MTEDNHIVKIEAGIAQVFLNRTAVHNALDEKLIADLTATFARLETMPEVRIVQLSGLGTSFCAGGDLTWMERTASYGFDENFADAKRLAEMLQSIHRLSKPTMALVNGPAYGGGLGLIAACDIAIAVDTAKFSLSEVRLGLLPATIGPYVLRKIGEGMARRYFLTGEVFEAADALKIGLVNEVVAAAELQNAAAWFVKRLREGGPQAQAAVKSLIARVAGAPIDEALMDDTARRIATQRASDEGKEGTRAFLEKRKPRWRS